MRLLNRLFTRQRTTPLFSALPDRVRGRLVPACRELTQMEEEIAWRLGLAAAPRLLMVDEEEAVILTPVDRASLS